METTLSPTCVPDGRTVWPVVWGCGLGGIPGVACRGVGVETDCDSNGVARSEDKVGQSAAGLGVPGIRGLVDCVAEPAIAGRRNDAMIRSPGCGGAGSEAAVMPVLMVLAVGAPIFETLPAPGLVGVVVPASTTCPLMVVSASVVAPGCCPTTWKISFASRGKARGMVTVEDPDGVVRATRVSTSSPVAERGLRTTCASTLTPMGNRATAAGGLGRTCWICAGVATAPPPGGGGGGADPMSLMANPGAWR